MTEEKERKIHIGKSKIAIDLMEDERLGKIATKFVITAPNPHGYRGKKMIMKYKINFKG